LGAFVFYCGIFAHCGVFTLVQVRTTLPSKAPTLASRTDATGR
jgi:hypothetical protein